MGYVNLPKTVKAGQNNATLELDHTELAHVVWLLNSAVKCLSKEAKQAPNVMSAANVSESDVSVDLGFLDSGFDPPSETSFASASYGYEQRLEQKLGGLQLNPTDCNGFTRSVPNVHQYERVAGESFKSTPVCGSRELLQVRNNVVRVPVEATPWKCSHTTEATEHNKERISSLLYCSVLEGLTSEWGHKGWLISASPKLINLWNCSQKPSEPPLQLVHSQAIDVNVEAMDADTNARLLLCLCSSPNAKEMCVLLLSLAASTFLKQQGMIRLQENASHICSLRSFGGALRNSFAVVMGPNILLYSLAAVESTAARIWKAHDNPITCIHANPSTCLLVTGSSEGIVRMWDMRTKPSAPIRQYDCKNSVMGLTMMRIEDAVVMSICGADGVVRFWDVGYSSRKKWCEDCVLDGKGLLNMWKGGENGICMTTRMGLYFMEVTMKEGMSWVVVSPLLPLPVAGPSTHLRWNSKTTEIYSSNVDGSISVYGRPF